MDNLSNRALISRLFSSAEQQLENAEIENWSQSYRAVEELSVPEKISYIIVKLNQKVTNGGFSEFYSSSFGIFAPEIIHVLTEINALSSAEIVSTTLSIVNPQRLLDDDYKALVYDVQLSEEQVSQLYGQDFKYDQLQDQENLEDLLGAYLQKMLRF